MLTQNALAHAIAARRDSGAILLDLTETNPTAAGFSYPPDVLSSLGHPRAGRYAPDPRGLVVGREAVAAEYAGVAGAPQPSAIVLTASTSEAYALLFKLLCDPDDEVLIPQPGYPLFEWLTGLEAVQARAYSLEYHGTWSIARESLEATLTPRTRAVLVVTPNNPTGSRLREGDREWLAAWCAERGLALISDEVFADYILSARSDAASLVGETRTLTFVLGGLSKSAGLPQVKLAWIIVSGPADLAGEALARMEVISDTYLSVSTPVQAAAPELLAAGRIVRRQIQARLIRNLGSLRAVVPAHPAVTLLEPEGGWSVVLRVPATRSEEALAIDLLESAGVVVHPGYFFDFAHGAFLVLSLLTDPATFDEGVGRILAAIANQGR